MKKGHLREACHDITITNCTLANGHGGVVIGSEMSGNVFDVTISDCTFNGTDRGIRLKVSTAARWNRGEYPSVQAYHGEGALPNHHESLLSHWCAGRPIHQ